MDISRANSRLSVIVFIIIAFSLNTSSQHLYSEEESEETAHKCTVYGSDFKRSSMETDQEEFNSKGIVRVPLLLNLHRSNYASIDLWNLASNSQFPEQWILKIRKKFLPVAVSLGGNFPPTTQPLLFWRK